MAMKGGSIFEDRKTAFALFLCFMLIIVYAEYLAQDQRIITPEAQQSQQLDSQAAPARADQAAAGSSTSQSTPTLSQTDSDLVDQSTPALEEYQEASSLQIRSALYNVQLSTLGGRFTNYELLNYKKELSVEEPLDLVSVRSGDPLPPRLISGTRNDDRIVYQVEGISEEFKRPDGSWFVPAGKTLRVQLVGTHSDGTEFRKKYIFEGSSFLFDIEASLSNAPNDGAPLTLEWPAYQAEENLQDKYDPVVYSLLKSNDKVEHVPIQEGESDLPTRQEGHWISLGDKYFMASLVNRAESESTGLSVRSEDSVYAIRLEGGVTEGAFKVYVGPKKYSVLEKIGYQLERNVNLGWFSFLALPLLMLVNLFYGWIGNYGLAIILLTLTIKLFFLPLTSKGFRSMKQLQDLQPEVKALRERVKDPTQLNQELMGLYKKRGVNPLGGCLPIVIQIPVFFGLYNALLYATELRHSPFALWVTDLSSPEKLYLAGIGVPVMLLLMGASMFLQQYFTPSAMEPAQRKIMLLFPVIFTVMFMIFPFPSGLVLYWLVNNLISIVQQVYLRTERKATPLMATLLASGLIFALGYVIVQFPLIHQ